MRVVIAGSRAIKDYDYVLFAIKKAYIHIDELISGGANGIDKLGEQWATENNVRINRFLADWDTHGKVAGFIRNGEMAEYCHAAIIIWDGKSKGTFNMIDNIRRLKKPLFLLSSREFNWWK
ncbi:MAG: DUF2493 domain-containing protein [Candidatus Levybacteria bacterium]|nr:DUF2493 domain-containing protein [Candidatus Levybacteria bacterium]